MYTKICVGRPIHVLMYYQAFLCFYILLWHLQRIIFHSKTFRSMIIRLRISMHLCEI